LKHRTSSILARAAAAALLFFFSVPLSAAHAGPVRAVPRTVAKANSKKLVKGLAHKRGYARELAARGLASLPSTSEGKSALVSCVERSSEHDYVRAACASTLASWKVKSADKAIISAMSDADAEARYWLAEALHRIGTREALGHLNSLTSDSDIYLATSAREWVK
jgi:HEAT repeat protein